MTDASVNSPKQQMWWTFQVIGTALSVIVGTKTVLIDLLSPSESWIRWYILVIVPVASVACGKILGISWKTFMHPNSELAIRRFTTAVLCFFSVLLILNLRLVYGTDSDGLFRDLLINFAISFLGFALFFLVPRLLGWHVTKPETWPINISSFVLGFAPWIFVFIVAAVIGSELRAFYFIVCLAYGASFTHILGYSHPGNLAYDIFIAKVILVTTLVIAVLAGLGGFSIGVILWFQGNDNMALVTVAAVAWWGFIVMLTAVEVVYQHQYQTRSKVDKMVI